MHQTRNNSKVYMSEWRISAPKIWGGGGGAQIFFKKSDKQKKNK